MDLISLGAAFLAGILTILNPCVLPVLPIVFGSASNAHRFGPLALAAGLTFTFTAIGLFVATIGFSLAIDSGIFRLVSAILLTFIGLMLIFPALQYRLQAALGPLGAWASKRADTNKISGMGGQFVLGGLLGAMWSPCVGPTLGAATLLASQGEALGSVTLAMLLFGLGVSVPLLLFGTVLRGSMSKWRSKLGAGGSGGRKLFGAATVMAGVLVITGFDKSLEIFFLDHAPSWMTELGTKL